MVLNLSEEVAVTPFEFRELYGPAHFGNTYEVALPNEMTALLEEARFWGFNRYADWFDTVDLRNPYTKNDGLYDMPEAVWARKFANYGIAARLGFGLTLGITPNHVFADQVTPANEATKTPGFIFGQLVCPSKRGVEDMILEFYGNLFRDFARRGLKLSVLSFGPYDYGGCACEACRPWIVTFGKLTRRIVRLASEFFPGIRAMLIGWWWTDEDHELFTRWANAEAPGLFSAMVHHIPYGETGYKRRPTPAGCAQRGFVHIGYGESRATHADVYGHYGPAVAPRRLERTLAFLREQGSDGFQAYSEGACDEINKAILAGLSSGRFRTADEVLEAYAERHLGGDAKGWAEWLCGLGEIGTLDPVAARRVFDRLAAASRPGLRLQALEEKLRMREADAAVRARAVWDPERLRAAREFWAAKERLWRGIWGLGLGRHAFKFDWLTPEWHREYAALSASGEAGPSPSSPREA